MATYSELKAQAEQLMREAESVRQQEVATVVREIRARMDEYGIAVEDLQAQRKAPRRNSGVVRFRGPNGEGWSGKGRQPQWLKDAMEQGRSKEDFAA